MSEGGTPLFSFALLIRIISWYARFGTVVKGHDLQAPENRFNSAVIAARTVSSHLLDMKVQAIKRETRSTSVIR